MRMNKLVVTVWLLVVLTGNMSSGIDLFKLRWDGVVKLTREEQMALVAEKERLCDEKRLQDPPGPGLYCNVTFDKLMCWDYTPAGTEAVQPCPNWVNGVDTAGFARRVCLEDGSWKPNLMYNNTDGWTNYTACVPPKPAKPEIDMSPHLKRIQLMSEIGYGLSLASLIVAVLIMIASKRLHCKSNVLHINLFLAFILRASITFFMGLIFVDNVGLEKDIIRHPGGTITFNKEGLHWECKLIVSVFMYAMAASMMWIHMEGLYLHMLVYKTLFTERHGTRLYVFVGWLSPFLYLIPWIIVRIFKENEFCWNQHETAGYLWILKAPMLLSTLINFCFFINIVRVLCVRANVSRHIKNDAHHLRKTAKFVLVLIPLFGVIYIVFAAFPPGMGAQADIIHLYCEMFYNSFQGFVLALLFCFLNEEVHNEIRRCWYRRRFNSRFNTRSILMSSWRKASRTSRDIVSRDTRVSDELGHSNVHCGDSCKLNKKCQEHVTWTGKKVDKKNGTKLPPISWKSEDYEAIVLESRSSNSGDEV